MQQKPDNASIKRGANLLLQGATLTDLSCPSCSSPLVRLKDGTLWCAKDEKKVVFVKEGEEPPKQPSAPSTSYDKLEATLMAKMQDIQGLSLIHISEPTRRTPISYAVFCLKKK